MPRGGLGVVGELPQGVGGFEREFGGVGGGELRVEAGIVEGMVGVGDHLDRVLPGVRWGHAFGVPDLAEREGLPKSWVNTVTHFAR